MANPRNARRPAPPNQEAANYSTITSTGIEPKVGAALAYILGLVTGILFLALEKDNRYIRFHAAQSITVSVLLILAHVAVRMVSAVLAYIPIVGGLLVLVLTLGLALGTFVLWGALMWRAYEGHEWELPVAGGFARRMV
jgi:uncharacterized membrane protein